AVEEQFIQAPIEIVVVLDVALGAGLWIELTQPTGGKAKVFNTLRPKRPVRVVEIGEEQVEEIVDRAPLHDEPPIHVGLAERQCRIEEQQPLGLAIGDAGDDRCTASIAESMGTAFGVDQAQISCRYDAIEGVPERAEHRPTHQPPPQTEGFQRLTTPVYERLCNKTTGVPWAP